MKLSCLAGWMISILLFCNYSHAQEFPFEKTFKSDYNHSIYNVHKTAAGNLLISTLSKPTDYLSSLSHAFLFDSLGNKLWVKDSSNPNFSVIENYLENREEIIFHGTAQFCAMDVIDYFYEWVFLRTDDSGMNYQYLSFYLPDSHELNGLDTSYLYKECKGVMLIEDDAIVAVGKTLFQRVSSNDEMEFHTNMTDEIVGIHQYSVNKALAFGDNQIYKLDINGNLDSLVTLPFEVLKKIHVNHQLVMIQSSERTFHVLDSTGTILHNYNAQEDFETITHVVFRDGYFWAMGTNANGLELKKYSESTGYELTQSIDSIDFKPVAFELWDNYFLVIGYEPGLRNKHIVFKGIEYNMPEIEIDYPDVGIDQLITPVVSLQNHPPYSIVTKYTHIRLRVKNYGNQTVDSLFLNGIWPGSIVGIGVFFDWCTGFHRSIIFRNLNLSPGQDTLLYFGLITINNESSLTEGNVCFWTSLPNGKRDLFSENDMVCSFEYILNTPTIEKDNYFLMYPNPATDFLNIKTSNSSTEAIQIRIFDFSGRLMYNELFSKQQEYYQIPLSSFTSGSYLIEIVEGEKFTRKMFIKSDY